MVFDFRRGITTRRRIARNGSGPAYIGSVGRLPSLAVIGGDGYRGLATITTS